MPSSNNALISSGALVSGGGRKTAAAGGTALVPGGPAYTPPVIERSADGGVYRRVQTASGEAIIKAGNAAGGVKRQLHTDEERDHFARVRKTGAGDVVMTPKDVGRGIANSMSPWAAITDVESQGRVRVFRECKMEAAALIWQGGQVPDWMLWAEGKEYNPPSEFEGGTLEAEASGNTKNAYDTPLIGPDPGPLGTGQTQTQAQQVTGTAQQAYEHTATTARLQQKIASLEAANQQLTTQVQQLQTRATSAFKPHKATIDIEGFGEVETTVDWYAITGDVLSLAYDMSKQRNILSPKPAAGSAVAQFILELHDDDEKHVFELVAAYSSRVEFPAAGPAGAPFQQFLISRHQIVSA